MIAAKPSEPVRPKSTTQRERVTISLRPETLLALQKMAKLDNRPLSNLLEVLAMDAFTSCAGGPGPGRGGAPTPARRGVM
jgi:hypothetical protein